MSRVVAINGVQAVAGLSWVTYAASTKTGIDLKESSFNFDGVAYLVGRDVDPSKKKPDKRILSAGYVRTEDLVASADSPDIAELLKLPSLMLWFIERAEDEGYGGADGVNGIFNIDLGTGEHWVAAIKGSKPLPFDASDTLVLDDQLHGTIEDLSELAEEIGFELNKVPVDAETFLSKKPSRNVGRIRRGRTSTLATVTQLMIVVILVGGMGFMAYDAFFAAEEQVANGGVSEAALRRNALSAYQRAMQNDFGYANALDVYAEIKKVSADVPMVVDQWSFIAVSCRAQSSECIFKFESGGDAAPSVLEDWLNQPVEVNLPGREALYRKPIDLGRDVSPDFTVPKAGSVRRSLLDAAAFLRSPGVELGVELGEPEAISIANGSFLRDTSFSAEYRKGSLSVSGPVGLMDVAAQKLSFPGVLITEVIINNDQFALRGHYAFN